MSRQSPYRAVSPKVDLPAMDRRIIDWWREHDIFARSLAATADGPRWVFYEGPPTANGTPGAHHLEARVFKDVFPRFKTMKGCSVPRRAGWDCHGLPVELAVEKELGISGKPDIERIGIAEFNARCRESVQRYVGEFEAMTERMGYWVDMAHPYRTMAPEYVDSVWWALQRIHERGLLSQDYRVAPYCPRCGTTLSDHEVAQGYENVEDPSAYVRLPVIGDVAGHDGVELLIWTTTPWTLVSNTAVAVHPDVTYVLARTERGTFVVAEPLAPGVLGEDYAVLTTVHGADLAGSTYRPPFDLVEIPGAHRVITAEYVSTTDGTGLVHQAPAFGADDLTACRNNGLPVVNPVGPDGRFVDDTPLVGGTFFKAADPVLVDDLNRRGLLFGHDSYEHPYPHCWRCHTPLMYYAQLSWYVRTTQARSALRRENAHTNWYPEHVKHGRYGDWLDNNVDWALSRSRYWGTPLPLWRCAAEHVTAVGSRAELGALAGKDLDDLDPHRPHIDEITIDCPRCGERAERVPEVIDAWFDSGSMPFAQLGYPHVPGSELELDRSYPAQYICEAIDQTRGWFYTLMAVGTLLFDRSSYENVVCLGHILAEDGRKMSKHLGNVLEPMALMDQHGADAVRWFMLCSGSPWTPRRIGHGPLDEIARKVLMTYWNTASFFSLYASLAEPAPAAAASERPVLDRWVLARVHRLAGLVDDRLENYDTASAGRELGDFLEELSNWYVRRSRQRFWHAEADALATLHECLNVVTRLLAPFIPFLTEQVWHDVVRPGDAEAADSVHLARWPEPDEALLDDALVSQVDTVRQLAEAGRAARKASKVRVRQPLGRALYSAPAESQPTDDLLDELAEELNVRELAPLSAAGEVLDVSVKPNFRALGKRFGKRTREVAEAISAADPRALAAGIRAGQADIDVDGETFALGPDEVVVNEVPRSGWAVQNHHEVTIALDTEITPELRRAGLAREVVRFVQDSRKRHGFEVADRVELHWKATGSRDGDSSAGETATSTDGAATSTEEAGQLRIAMLEHSREIAEAVLAVRTAEGAPESEDMKGMSVEDSDPGLGLAIWLRRARSC